MSQLLIVEGNDAIALASLLAKRKLPPPVGYAKPQDFKDKFVKIAKGIQNIPHAINEALSSPELKNLGVIIDANEAGYLNRLDSVLSQIAENIEIDSAIREDSGSGKIIKTEQITIGIWIMPDNQNNGYLEHFLASLISSSDSILPFAGQQIEALKQSKLQLFSEAKKQKALLHTWLAWQKEPGKPFGQAVDAGYFDVNAAPLLQFEEWFKNTFELGSP